MKFKDFKDFFKNVATLTYYVHQTLNFFCNFYCCTRYGIDFLIKLCTTKGREFNAVLAVGDF